MLRISICVLLILLAGSGNDQNGAFGFAPSSSFPFVVDTAPSKQSSSTTTIIEMNALSERQMQFWEDVEDGLDDIENFYAKKSQDIDRIREFGKK